MKKKNKFLIFSILIFLMTLTISLKYAYSFFVSKVSEENKTETSVSSKKLGLIFNDKTKLDVPSLEPGQIVVKEFEVVSDSDDPLEYNIKFVNISNSYKEDVVYRLYKDGKKVIDNTRLPENSEYNYIYNNVTINPKEKHEYTLEIEYLIYEDKLQVRDYSNEFKGTLEIDTEEYSTPKCVISGVPTSWSNSASLVVNKDEDNDNVYSWDNSNYSKEKTKEIQKNGTYTAYVKNKFGLVENCSVTISKIDTTNPSTPVITNSSNGNWTNANVVITASSSDSESGLNRIEYSYDEKSWSTKWDSTMSDNKVTGTWSTNMNNTVYIRAVDNAGNVSLQTTTNIKIDKVSPTLNVVSGSYDKSNSTAIISSNQFGASGGTVYCINTSRSNAAVSKISDIATLGVNSITCTATSNSGMKTTKTSNIIINTTLTYGNGLNYTENSTLSGNNIILNNGGVQFGPYYNTNKGCYRVTYYGNNLNSNPALDNGKSGYLNYRAYTNSTGVFYTLSNPSFASTQVSFNMTIPSDVNRVEISAYNLTQTQVTISSAKIEYIGTSC